MRYTTIQKLVRQCPTNSYLARAKVKKIISWAGDDNHASDGEGCGTIVVTFCECSQHQDTGAGDMISPLTLALSSIVSKSIAKVAKAWNYQRTSFNSKKISFSHWVWHYYHGWFIFIRRFHLMKSTTQVKLWSTKLRFQNLRRVSTKT